jgi:hypothetical protein
VIHRVTLILVSKIRAGNSQKPSSLSSSTESNRYAEAYGQSQCKQQEIARRLRMWQKIRGRALKTARGKILVVVLLPSAGFCHKNITRWGDDEADFY